MATWCLLATVTLLHVYSTYSLQGDSECSTICSKDYLWLVGDEVVWNCTLDKNCGHYSANDIYFEHRRNQVPNNMTEIVNEKTKVLRIADAKPCDGPCVYYVYVKEGKPKGSIEMKIGEKPLPPEVEVKYIIFNEVARKVVVNAIPLQTYQWYNMSVDYGFESFPPDYMYDLDFLNDNCQIYIESASGCGNATSPYPCDCPKPDLPTHPSDICSLANEGRYTCFFEDYSYFFRVNMTTIFGSAIQTVNLTLSEAIAEAPGVTDIDVTSRSSVNLAIKWKYWKNLSAKFKITICAENRSNCQEPVKTPKNYINFSNLIPNMMYHIKIETRMSSNPKWGNGNWTSLKTLEDIPYSSPGVSPGSYSFSDDGLHVFIKAIPSNETNGNLTSISVILKCSLSDELRRFEFHPSNSTLFFKGIKKLDECHVKIRGCTSVGCSNRSSLVVIPKKSLAPPKPFHIIAEKQPSNVVKLTWNKKTKKNMDASRIWFIVHKCILANRLAAVPDCVEYDWQKLEVDGDITSHNITLPPSVQLDDIRVGVSMMVGNISSEVAWSACLYDSGTVPLPVSSLQSHVLENEITVEWHAPDCHQHSSYPSSYDVRYGKLEDNNKLNDSKCATGTYVSVPAADCTHDGEVQEDVSSACVKQLTKIESSQGYYVCVRAKSEKGPGVWREVKNSADDSNKLVVVLGCVFGVIVVVGCLICACWKIRKKKKDNIVFKLPELGPDDDGYYDRYENGYRPVAGGTNTTDLSPTASCAPSWPVTQSNGVPVRERDETRHPHNSGSSTSPLQNPRQNDNRDRNNSTGNGSDLPLGGDLSMGSGNGQDVASDDVNLDVVKDLSPGGSGNAQNNSDDDNLSLAESDEEVCDLDKRKSGNYQKRVAAEENSKKSNEKSSAAVARDAPDRVSKTSQSSSAASYSQMGDDQTVDEEFTEQGRKKEKLRKTPPKDSESHQKEELLKERKSMSKPSAENVQIVDSMV